MAILPTMLVISMLLLFLSPFSSAKDTITNLESLPDDDTTLVSKDGTFELGFFNPGSSSNRYVGIWYKIISVRTVVWVANRDNPIKGNSSQLIINQDGNLVLINKNNSILWSTNATTKAASPVAQLLDTGNLVIREENNNNEEFFSWQSFDHPCDTVLPGMKIGWDRKTGLNKRLVAWKNWDDPSSGDLSSDMVITTNPESLIWKGSVKYYRTGPWTGPRSSSVVGLMANPLYDYKFVNNEEGVYYMFTLKNSSVISILVLNQTRSLRQRLIWIPQSKTWTVYQSLPQDDCDSYDVCGANGNCIIDRSPRCQCLDGFEPKLPQQWNAMDWTEGCVRSEKWRCGVKNRDGFSLFSSMKLPDTTNSWINENMTLKDCAAKCLENCSCTAYANLDPSGGGSGCSIWFGDLVDLRVSPSGQDLYVRTDTSDTDAKDGGRKKVVLTVTITVSVVLVMMLLGFSYICITKTKNKEVNKTMLVKEIDEGGDDDLELPFFDVPTILNATNNFSINNKLGEGGFGPVYKGTLLNGQEIAIKRLSRSSGQGLIEFKNEVILCAKLQHRNLVKVIGCCIEGEEKMLVYEYMSNKSLDSFIFDSVQSKLLDWCMRFNILYGIARGLLYLHEDSRLRIIHRDLKASNILLDNYMNPKISDFGMARICGGDQIEGTTNRIVGTYGYMAPEYAIDGLFSIKSDVFSFGVLLLEIVSGRKNRALTYHDHDHNLIEHAWRLWKEGNAHELIDDCMSDSCIKSEVLRCIQIALLCLQHHPDDRPNMTSVVVMLSSENSLPEPKEPGFLIKKVSIEGEHSSGKQTSSSMNEITISIHAR
ncbi:G-type lectin S-receptor-like serine/threonine-protein kinase At4g27290 isoform X2 [Lotus japonicus]|uniref:G-type lectin S-receptor-like serine/threonine-protein kinase At4g27290 isoform X2 n=1 Tax=Lotus japonicus TaxID=34305 RepID=UPI0025834AF4|nr:G-type lectin S-receptor-like serine/threonine-protein kinase At4g27290 isoform X2 [Lotus japonicus]